MSTNLIDLFKSTIGDTLVRQTSGFLGESSQSISSSLESIVPSLLGTMILKGNTDTGAKGLLEYISGNGLDDATMTETGFLEGGSGIEQLMAKGSGVLQYLVGDRLTAMMDWISGGGGLKTSSASSLLKMVAPLLMGFVGRLVKERSLNASGVKDLLLSQSEYVKQSTPSGLSELLGFSSLGEPVAASSANMSSSGGTNAPVARGGMSKFLPWLVLGLASLGLFYFLQKGCNAPPPTAETPPATEKPDSSISASPTGGPSAIGPPAPGMEKLKTYALPDGAKLNAEPNTFTALMVEYLNGKRKAGKCIAFDQISFLPGTANLTPKSDEQLYHLLLILNAYPGVNIIITGYTDNVGDDNHNLELSEARAVAIQEWLVFRNVDVKRLQSKGMGEAKPIASNDTAKAQEKNRRVEVCVVKKG